MIHIHRFLFGALVLASSASNHVLAHHSYAAHYYEDRRTIIEGQVAAFEFRNPHARVLIDVPDSRRRRTRVIVEWSNTRTLHEQGITRYVLKRGDRVRIQGSPSRADGNASLHMKAIERPADGWKWAARAQPVTATR
ncbi:MAG: DUF6152 family protein [Vicinamibacterales bacterium]